MQDLSDRALKERIVGAAVLVFVAVLVVPVFLDGTDEDQQVISTSVRLPGQTDGERKQQTIVLTRDRSEPMPVTQAGVGAESPPPAVKTSAPDDAEAEIVQVRNDPEPASQNPSEVPPSEAPVEEVLAEETLAGEISETGMWAVQLGSFSEQKNAERLAGKLRGQGYAAFLSQLDRNGKALHRVRIGPQKDRDSAVSVAAELGKGGHKGQVVPHP